MSEAEGKSTLVVGTTHVIDYRLEKAGPRKIQLHLLNTRIPSYRQRPLITTRFNSAVDRVIPTQPTKTQNESVISIELREAVPYVAEQTDNLLMVHFEPSNIPPKPLEQANLPAWKRVLSDTESQPMASTAAAETALAPLPPAVTDEQGEAQTMMAELEAKQAEDEKLRALLGFKRKAYTGEKIALDFYETDIKNVFRILREVSGNNFAIDKDVSERSP